MGLIISRFRKHPTTKEKLQTLVKEIRKIEEFQLNTQKRQKNIVGRFIILSVFLFISAALCVYFLYLPERLIDRVICFIPFLFFPFLIVLLKRIITWYYSRKIRRDEIKLVKLKEEKKNLLDEVMDKETYKNAKEILEVFAPEQLQKEAPKNVALATPIAVSRPIVGAQGGPQDLRRRTIGPVPTPMQQVPGTPRWGNLPPSTTMNSYQQGQNLPLRPSLPRPVLPRERSVLDRLVDVVLGDGPSNRYALVCRQCCSHNGMAMPEDFEYIAYRCCYCSAWNPARKQRPQAPLLPKSVLQGDEEGESSPSSSSSETEDVKAKNVENVEQLELQPETENATVPEVSETEDKNSVESVEKKDESDKLEAHTFTDENAQEEKILTDPKS